MNKAELRALRATRYLASPTCQTAGGLAKCEFYGEHQSIEFLRAVIESAPGFPDDIWTVRDGEDYARMWQGR